MFYSHTGGCRLHGPPSPRHHRNAFLGVGEKGGPRENRSPHMAMASEPLPGAWPQQEGRRGRLPRHCSQEPRAATRGIRQPRGRPSLPAAWSLEGAGPPAERLLWTCYRSCSDQLPTPLSFLPHVLLTACGCLADGYALGPLGVHTALARVPRGAPKGYDAWGHLETPRAGHN